MALIVKCNKGFSLIELMIALFILAFSLLGFLGVMATSIDSNLQNELRNTAIGLTTQVAETLLAQDFDAVAPADCSLTPYDGTNTCIGSNFQMYPNPNITVRGFTQTYTITWTITDLNLNLKQITINTTYTHRGQNFSHDSVIYKHREL